MTQRRSNGDQDERSRRRDEDDLPYKVGYRKPPPAHRFPKGQSGNPAGSKPKRGKKKRRAKSLREEVIDELGQSIAVTEGGQRRHIPRQTALVKKIVADSLNGDPKSRAQLIQLINKAEANPETEEAEDLIGAAADAEILELFRADIIRQYRESNDE